MIISVWSRVIGYNLTIIFNVSSILQIKLYTGKRKIISYIGCEKKGRICERGIKYEIIIKIPLPKSKIAISFSLEPQISLF